MKSTKLYERDFKNSFKKKIVKKFAQFLSKPCRNCGKERLLSAIDYYLGKKHKCLQCQITSNMILPVIILIFHRLSISPATAGKIGDVLSGINCSSAC